MESFRQVLHTNTVLDHQDDICKCVPNGPLVGEVQLVVTPLAVDEVMGQYEDNLSALLNVLYYVIDNPFPWLKVPLVDAYFVGWVRVLQLREKDPSYPIGIKTAIRDKGVVVMVPGLVSLL